MRITPEIETLMTRYLLGELSPDESLVVEARYFEDAEFFEWMQCLEDEILRDFVREEMASDLRQRFEARYLNVPKLLEKVKFTEAVVAECAKLRSERQIETVVHEGSPNAKFSLRGLLHFRFRWPVVLYGSATVLGLLMALAVFVVWKQNSGLHSTISQLQQEKSSLEQEKTKLHRALDEKPRDVPLVASFILNPGLSRSVAIAAPFVLPAGIGMVQLKMPLPSGLNYKDYRMELQRLPSGEVSSQDLAENALVDSGRSMVVSIPSVSLKSGRYILYLKGLNARGEFETVQYYPFTIDN